MNRRNFISTGCISCLAGTWMLSTLEACRSSKIINASITGSDLIVLLPDFEINKSDIKKYKRYIVVQNERLLYPICVYRIDENNYKALWMKCTHQGTELQVFGDKLQCPAHGSAFNYRGKVENGPANTSLRTFPVTIHNNELKISLK